MVYAWHMQQCKPFTHWKRTLSKPYFKVICSVGFQQDWLQKLSCTYLTCQHQCFQVLLCLSQKVGDWIFKFISSYLQLPCIFHPHVGFCFFLQLKKKKNSLIVYCTKCNVVITWCRRYRCQAIRLNPLIYCGNKCPSLSVLNVFWILKYFCHRCAYHWYVFITAECS